MFLHMEDLVLNKIKYCIYSEPIPVLLRVSCDWSASNCLCASDPQHCLFLSTPCLQVWDPLLTPSDQHRPACVSLFITVCTYWIVFVF
ncbi:hypothetical protein GDO86_017890 [Hymenochirus boettgeri]|uniref:Uncharacterized protein n=1 Tax=Hymenochirus boettgeri TaxID=247094 RepID=A0A8T2II10_9PIPI|nr:hypothetical protein GDO86_017890 [Hymenochirus boettgeri]